jgi:hypothetical protein
MRLPWRREAKSIRPACLISPRHAELETAKEILCEIFHAQPADVEDMIQRRLTENRWTPRDGLWPATFCLMDCA